MPADRSRIAARVENSNACSLVLSSQSRLLARASEISGKNRKKTQKTNRRMEKSTFFRPQNPPTILAKVGEEPTTHSNATRTMRENKGKCLCTRQNNSKVPARRELVLECMLQQHTKCAEGKRKGTTRFLLGVAKYKESAMQERSSMCQECIKTPPLLLGIAKKKESATQKISGMCHECIKTTHMHMGVAKYKESTTKRINSMCHECVQTTRLLLGVAKKQRVRSTKNR